MLVTFHSSAWSSVTLFGEVAAKLLKMAGHSGTIPSAVRASDVSGFLSRLQQALNAMDPAEDAAAGADMPQKKDAREKGGDAPPPVGLKLRAYPLIQLLTAAAQKNADVTWEEGAPAV